MEAEITNSIGMKLVLIPAGEFMMGSPDSDAQATDHEKPQHPVRITRPFYLGVHEVTVGQFCRFVEAAAYKTEAERHGEGGEWNESEGKFKPWDPKYNWRNTEFEQTDVHPVVNVTWNVVVAFCEWLSRMEGHEYRLPTEAEWEYACRAGTTTRWCFGDETEGLVQVANVADAMVKAKFPGWRTISESDNHLFTAPVGSFRANAWGLYDMHGNVWEWCADWYDASYYRASAATDPKGPDSGVYRVLRGGSWLSDPGLTRSAGRLWNSPGSRHLYAGFRLARTP
ncbi:MAG TPA: formylglycine-generating enzyme family protein [Thermoguttaceae bacterium]|nr:formylglycine-generating enzyme family protein [Thermoguttaceae bacterium]